VAVGCIDDDVACASPVSLGNTRRGAHARRETNRCREREQASWHVDWRALRHPNTSGVNKGMSTPTHAQISANFADSTNARPLPRQSGKIRDTSFMPSPSPIPIHTQPRTIGCHPLHSFLYSLYPLLYFLLFSMYSLFFSPLLNFYDQLLKPQSSVDGGRLNHSIPQYHPPISPLFE
jgi:hypothetical protein